MNRLLIALAILAAGAALALLNFTAPKAPGDVSSGFCEDQYWLEQQLRFQRPIKWLQNDSPQARDMHVEMAKECYPDSPYYFTVGQDFFAFHNGELRKVTQ